MLFQSIFFLVLFGISHILLKASFDKTTAISILNELTSNCEFNFPQNLQSTYTSHAIDWCLDSPKRPMINLMNHIRLSVLNTPKDTSWLGMILKPAFRATFAGQFGSNVKLIYIPELDLFLINPSIIFKSEALIECVDFIGDEEFKEQRHDEIQLSFLNGDFIPQTMVFSNDRACLLQTILKIM